MFSKDLKRFAAIILGFKSLDKKTQKAIINHKSFLNVVCEIARNIYKQNYKISINSRKRLEKFKAPLIYLCNKNTNKQKIRHIQTGRGFFLLPLLFSLVAPVLKSIINRN
jgi:hypothetical protein